MQPESLQVPAIHSALARTNVRRAFRRPCSSPLPLRVASQQGSARFGTRRRGGSGFHAPVRSCRASEEVQVGRCRWM